MKLFWGAALNVVAIGLSVGIGYAEMEPQLLSQANPDAVFCTVVLLGTIFFAPYTVWYSIRGAKQSTLRRPSWRRFAIDWWHDPLQCLFLTSCCAGAMMVGAALRLPGTSQTGFWMFMFFASMFLGFLIGQVVAYVVYREHIANT
jgi:hypothetical protein